MPVLISFFSSLFASMFNAVFLWVFEAIRWATLKFTRKFFVVALWVASVSVAVSFLVDFISNTFLDITATIPEVPYLPYFMPNNLVFCLQIIASVHAVSATYSLAARIAAKKAEIFAA